MVIVVTSLELRRPAQFFKLSMVARGIMLQAKRNPACIQFKNTGFWKLHFTMTSWEDREAMQRFSRSGEHLAAMRLSKELSREIRTYTFEAEQMPSWKEAKAMLREKGKSLVF